jgi:hypothetical protein
MELVTEVDTNVSDKTSASEDGDSSDIRIF